MAETVTVAKRDLKAGEVLDGIGGYTIRGTFMAATEADAFHALPMGLVDSTTTMARDKKAGEVITYGKQLVIDGGFAKAYQKTTGIAGYTLTFNSYGLTLISHRPFESVEKAILEGVDIKSTKQVIESTIERKRVKDTDIGKTILAQVYDLEMLITAYRKGFIKEKLY